MSTKQRKQIIKKEFPEPMRKDEETQEWIVNLSRVHFADKETTESRFDVLLEEFRKEREEQNKKWEKNHEELRSMREEQSKKWKENHEELRSMREEQNKKWEKNHEELHVMVASIERLSRKHDSTIGALGARWGLHAESSFRNAMQAILEEDFKAKILNLGEDFKVKVLNVVEYDDAGEAFGRPEQIELDIVIKNGLLIIVEIKSSMSRWDMHAFYKKVQFYAKKHQQKVSKMVVISPMVDKKAVAVAKELGIEICSYADAIEFD